MAKAHSPLRLQEALVRAADIEGDRLHRSIAEQIEYWADLGRRVSKVLNPDDLLAVTAGLALLRVEKVEVPDIDPEAVFASLEEDIRSGALASAIAEDNPIRYQASASHPGMLEQIDAQGQVTVGRFRNGEFHPEAAQVLASH